MSLKIASIALLLMLASPATAQEPTPIDVAILTCVGPGYVSEGDPFEILDTLPEKYCLRACKAVAQGCKLVVRAIDKCGTNFLKASAKIDMEICRGWGYSARECRVIRDWAKEDVAWWKEQGRIEVADRKSVV